MKMTHSKIVSAYEIGMPGEKQFEGIDIMARAFRLYVDMEQALIEYKERFPDRDVKVQEERVESARLLADHISKLDSRVLYWKQMYLKSQTELSQLQSAAADLADENKKLKQADEWGKNL